MIFLMEIGYCKNIWRVGCGNKLFVCFVFFRKDEKGFVFFKDECKLLFILCFLFVLE